MRGLWRSISEAIAKLLRRGARNTAGQADAPPAPQGEPPEEWATGLPYREVPEVPDPDAGGDDLAAPGDAPAEPAEPALPDNGAGQTASEPADPSHRELPDPRNGGVVTAAPDDPAEPPELPTLPAGAGELPAPARGEPPTPATNTRKPGRLRARWAAMSPDGRLAVKLSLPVIIAILLFLSLIPAIRSVNRRTVEATLALEEEQQEEQAVPEPFAVDDSNFLRTGEVILSGVDGMTKAQLEEAITITPRAQFVCYTDQRRPILYIAEHRNVEYKVTLHDYDAGTSQSAVVNEDPLTVTMRNASSSLRLDADIRLEFSHPVGEDQITKYISLSSEYGQSVPYTAEIDGELVTLTPSSTLEFDTDYFVLIGDLKSLNGKLLYGGATLEFWTMNYNFKLSLTNPQAQLLPESTPLALEFETINRYQDRTAVTINIYRFESLQKYADQAHILTDYDLDLDILERVDTHLDLLPSALHEIELELPGEGAYLIEVIAKNPSPGPFDALEYRFRKAVCVTDLALYLQTSRDQTLAWLNHSGTGAALEGYRIEFATATKGETAASVTTDAQGVGSFFYSMGYDDARPEVVRIYSPDDELVYIDNTGIINQYYASSSELYYSFFYADRAIYQPSDEISFWGYVRSYRMNENPTPSELEVVFDPGGLDLRVPVSVDAYGTFNGVIELEQIKSSQYVIQVQIPSGEEADKEDPAYYDYYSYGSGVLDRLYVDVKDYEKPTFLISSSVDKLFYRWDEEVTVSVTPTFYDGTPLPGYDLEFSVFSSYYGSEGAVQIITTDSTGTATVSFPAYQLRGETSWGPVQNRYQVRLASDGENILHNGSYNYFPSDTMLVGAISAGGSNGPVLTVNADEMTLASIDSEEAYYSLYATTGSYYSDYYSESRHSALRGAAKDLQVTAEVSYSIYNIFGEWTSKSYTTTLETVGGVAVLDELITEQWLSDYSASVSVTISAVDGQNHTVSYSSYWYNSSARYGGSGSGGAREKVHPPGYSLAAVSESGEDLLDDYYEYYTYNTMSAGDGESMTFSLLLDGEPIPNEGRMLYTLIQNEIVEQGVVGGDSFTLTQQVDYANSITLVVAYFDGVQVRPVRDTYISFDRSSVTMDIEVAADQAVYRPGDTVTLTVRATDPDGNGVAGNAVVSVVDEAVFALKEQYISLLSDLYGDMSFYNTYVRKYTTTTGDYNLRESLDGGKGDGDSLSFYDSYRKDFKDTAAFLPVRTDANGYATVSFVLPDNTTSWRITTLSIGDNLYGGQQQDNIISTLPFFISPVVSSKYIEGDEVAMLVQGHGTLLDDETEIEYTVRLFGDDFDETMSLTNTSFESNLVSFGQLPVGEYTLVATARYSGYSDTVELPVVVIPSNIELIITRDLDSSREPLEIGAMRYPVTLTFYDRENEPFFRALNSLLHRSSYRVDQRAARSVSRQALMSYMDEDGIPQYILDNELSLSDYQNWDGGIAWYEGGDSDPTLTAKMLLVAPEQFNHSLAAEYLREEIRYTRDGKVRGACYMGLAWIGEPVLDEVRALLADEGTLLGEQLYLMAALAFAGDSDAALALYEAQVTPRLAESARDGHYIALPPLTHFMPNAYQFRIDEDRLSATAWITASYLGLEDADEFARYFANGGWRINSAFETMLYVNWYEKEIPARSFTYTVNGAARTVDLGVSGRRSVRFSRSELEGLSLEGVPEGIIVSAYYIGGPDEADFEPSENFTVEKTVEEIQPGRYAVEITVRFGENAPTGYYDISEWIPSNMRLYSADSSRPADAAYSARWWSESQKIYFSVNRYSKLCEEATVRYIAQQTFDSAAMIDSVYVIHTESGQSAMTEKWVLGEYGG